MKILLYFVEDQVSIAIGKPERQACKASLCESKQQQRARIAITLRIRQLLRPIVHMSVSAEITRHDRSIIDCSCHILYIYRCYSSRSGKPTERLQQRQARELTFTSFPSLLTFELSINLCHFLFGQRVHLWYVMVKQVFFLASYKSVVTLLDWFVTRFDNYFIQHAPPSLPFSECAVYRVKINNKPFWHPILYNVLPTNCLYNATVDLASQWPTL